MHSGVRVEVADDRLSTAALAAVAELAADDVPARLADSDPTLWGPPAAAEASLRLGWLRLPESSQELIPRLDQLRDDVHSAGLDHVVLAGMGGSSLAPEVIARMAGAVPARGTTPQGVPAALTVLDTTDPGQVRRALADRLDRTVVVVASKSGTTVETDSQRRIYEQAFRDAGLDPSRRLVAVTDPGTPLAAYAAQAGFPVVTADPSVGGRYSALSAFGLVPCALAGIDVADLLDDALELSHALGKATDNPALMLGALLGAAWRTGQDKLTIATTGPELAGAGDWGLDDWGFGDWAEQLIAESTGKDGRGLLPVVVESTDAAGFAGAGADTLRVTLGGPGGQVGVYGPLGAQFLLWEYATAVAGLIIGINPFDQPNVQESKDNTSAILAEGLDPATPDGDLVYENDVLSVSASGFRTREPLSETHAGEGHHVPRVLAQGALHNFGEHVPADGYLAVTAYHDRVGDAVAAGLRPALARRVGRPVTFGWGPRYLHSTGQYHKGGPQNGAFLQVTGTVDGDVDIPGRPYTLGQLQAAQAAGDRRALRARGRPLLHIHLKDRAAGLRTLLEALE